MKNQGMRILTQGFVIKGIAVFFMVLTSVGALRSQELEKSVTALVDGTSITTADVVASVEVRAKSLSLGFCEVEISSLNNTVRFHALPVSWSNWNVLFRHIGSKTARISVATLCDTGALFQVRYFR